MSRHVVILGAGVIGLSAALACARRGMRVTVLDRQPEQRNGCSFGNAGMVVPSHFMPLASPGMVGLGLKWMWNPQSPFYIQPRLSWDLLAWAFHFWRASTPQRAARAAIALRDLSLLSRSCFIEHARSGPDFGLVQKGLLMLCKTAHALDEEARTAAKAQALGIPAQVLDPRATAALDPAVSMDVAGSVFFPKDCHLPPERYLAFLHHELTSLGAEFRWNTEVTSWQTTDSRIRSLQTPAGPVTGDEFVLCGGSWSALSARSLDLHLPLQAGKGYSLTLAQPRQLPSLCAIFTEARVAITPMNGALRVGGTMELAGLNESINLQRVRGIIRSVPRYYPQFREEDFHGIQPWHGLRPCTPDGLPYLGRTARWDNLLCATGHAMMGLSLAPATGLLVAELASGAAPSADLSLFSPDRFSAF